MSRRARRLIPSPAMIVALTALVMSLGGSAYALVITGKSIRNNTVTGFDIRNRSLTGTDVRMDKLGGKSIKESSLGIVPAAASAGVAGGTTHWAVLNANGVAVRGRGLSPGDPAARTSDGIYHVIFNRDVRGCAYQATLGNDGPGAPPQNGHAMVAPHPSNPNAVRIRTENGAGTEVDKPFHLVVSC